MSVVEEAIQRASRCLRDGDTSCQVAQIHINRGLCSLDILKETFHVPDVESENIQTTLLSLKQQLKDQTESRQNVQFAAPRVHAGGRGRPPVHIAREHLQMFHDFGYSSAKMAKHFGCSTSLVYRRLYEEGIQQRGKYSDISDNELDDKVKEIHSKHPNTGSTMMSGFLKADDINIQRHRVRSSLARVDPTSVAERLGKTVKRRTYAVASPNSLWHIDGHMKLIRWGLVTHGCIDGYSRMIPYLWCSTNNKATTVLRRFVPAVQHYGIPARVRADHGKENLLVGLFMNLANGPDSNSVLTGRSVHNQRIERLWRDVYQQVVDYFHKFFYEMEDEEILDINSSMDRFALQFVFVPIINGQLEHFRLAWNKHKLRTESNRACLKRGFLR